MARVNKLLQILHCLHRTGLIKTRPVQKLLVRVKFTGNSYSYWNTRKLVFTGTHTRVPGLVSMWMHPQAGMLLTGCSKCRACFLIWQRRRDGCCDSIYNIHKQRSRHPVFTHVFNCLLLPCLKTKQNHSRLDWFQCTTSPWQPGDKRQNMMKKLKIWEFRKLWTLGTINADYRQIQPIYSLIFLGIFFWDEVISPNPLLGHTKLQSRLLTAPFRREEIQADHAVWKGYRTWLTIGTNDQY